MRVKDLQFAKYFLLTEIDLPPETTEEFLDCEIEIKDMGEPDSVVDRGSKLVFSNPSSTTMFLFRTLYALLSRKIESPIQRDKMGLALMVICKDYVYHDYKPKELSGPPVVIDPDKLSVPSFIIHEVVEPLIGKVKLHPVLFMPCKYTDTCRIIKGSADLQREYSLKSLPVGHHDFPMVLCNCNVHNSAAQLAHTTVKLLELAVGKEKTHKILKHVLLNEDADIIGSVIMILKTLRGEIDIVISFLDYLEANALLSDEERHESEQLQMQAIQADSYLKHYVKVADAPQTSQVSKQWSQWSAIMGLIEKQLSPMRGSMWPASENLRPHEDNLRALIKEDAQRKGKTQTNTEEMLEVARDLYDHNAIEPGTLIENLLKDVRVWKQ
jgi:hypothetical protein